MGVATMNASMELVVTLTPNPISTTDLSTYRYVMTLTVLSYVNPFIILFGLISNIINIIVFLKSGAKDNVTILLIALAVSDLSFLSLISPTVGGFLFMMAFRPNPRPFDLRLLIYLLYWPAFTAYDLSCFIAVSLGVIRCACVAMPLKFKLVFTKSRTIMWAIFLVALAILLRMPVLIVNRIDWKTDPATNVTTPYLFSWNRASMLRINSILNRGIVVYLSYITMVLCVVILSVKLYQASKIRQNSTSTGDQSSEQASDKSADHRLSSRDLQVVKYVVLVCSIFIMAQLPFVISATVSLANSRSGGSKVLKNVVNTINQVSISCYYLNASVNIFIHYNFNSKYKAVFRSLIKDTKK